MNGSRFLAVLCGLFILCLLFTVETEAQTPQRDGASGSREDLSRQPSTDDAQIATSDDTAARLREAGYEVSCQKSPKFLEKGSSRHELPLEKFFYTLFLIVGLVVVVGLTVRYGRPRWLDTPWMLSSIVQSFERLMKVGLERTNAEETSKVWVTVESLKKSAFDMRPFFFGVVFSALIYLTLVIVLFLL